MDVTTDCTRNLIKDQYEPLMVSLSCENIVLWRGHFNATGLETSVNLSINGGEGNFRILLFLVLVLHSTAFAASVWLNSHFLGTSFGKYVWFISWYEMTSY